jgi:DNA polymerase III delta subunit
MPRYAHLHVIHGDDDFLRLEAIRASMRELLPAGGESLDLDRVDGRSLDAGRVSDVTQTMSLFSTGGFDGRRVLFVDDADQIRTDVLSYVLNTFDADNGEDGAFGVMLVYGLGKPPAKAAAEKAGVVREAKKLDWKTSRTWLADYARRRHAQNLSSAAMEALFSAVGMADAGVLANEVDKLVDLADGGHISVELINESTGMRVGRSPYDLCDALGRKDPTRAAEILTGVLGQPEYDGVRVTITLGYHLADLLRLRARVETGETANKAAASLFPRYWPKKRDELIAQSRNWTMAELDHAADLLLDVDVALKSGAKDHTFQILSSYLFQATE